MKKILLSLGAAVLLAAGAQAQTEYGLKAGVNLGEYTHSPGQTVNTSFYVTGYADLSVAPNFSIQPGISLQGKGNKYQAKYGTSTNVETTRNVMSIEIPVNAVYYIPTGESGKFFLGAGPYIGFNVSGRDKISGKVDAYSGSQDRKLKLSGDNKDLNVIDAGANFLGGYKFSNGFLLNAGYNLGLTNIAAGSNKIVSNRVWQFGVGFQF